MKRRNNLLNLIWIAIVTFAVSFNVHARNGDFGLGVIIGEPTGPSFKVWTSSKTAIDGAVAWSLEGDNDMHLHADYLFHDYNVAKVDKGSFPLYYGIGGRILFHDGNRDNQVGVRVPVGFSYLFANSPLELFFEVVPIVDLTPDTELDFNGGVGVRYYFGK